MDDDLDFDFFDEETQEAAREEKSGDLLRGRLAGPRGLRPGQVGMRRAAAGIAAAIVLTVIVVFATQGSSGPSAADRVYLTKLSTIATSSHRVGQALGQLLARVRRDGGSSAALTMLDRLIGRAQSDLASVEKLKPPAGLLPEHEQVLASLQFRVQGVQGLRGTLGQALGSRHPGM